MIELGGNIELTGFSELDSSSLRILKKIVGNYGKRFEDICQKFEKLSVTMKEVHKTEGSEKFELNAKLIDNGTNYTSSITDRNLFFAFDTVLKKLENSLVK